jgi:uncharacterized membrane protein YfcA
VVGVLTVGGVVAHGGAGTVTPASAAALVLIGIAAGALAGLLGVGGGVLFVPGLALFCGLDQIEAEATSLLAIVLAAVVGTLRQHRYGNLDVRLGVLVALGSIPGAVLGVVTVNLLPVRITEVLFGLLLLLFAAQLASRATRREPGARRRRVGDHAV